MKIGNKIAARRKELGMTQQELADKLFVSVKTISKWETNRGNPEMSMLPQIAKVLDINIAELFDGSMTQEDEINVLENNKPNIMNASIEFGIVLFGFIFFFLTFFSFTSTLSQSLPWDNPLFDNIYGSTTVTYDFSGYQTLFKMSGENFLGFLMIFGVWISFIAILSHIAFGVTEFIKMNPNQKSIRNRASFIISIVELVAILISLIISASSSFELGIGGLLITLLFIAYLVYKIIRKRKGLI